MGVRSEATIRMMLPGPARVRRRTWADSFRRPTWWSFMRTAVLRGPKSLPPPMAINFSWTSRVSRRMSVGLQPQRSSRYVALSRSPGGPAGSAMRRERRILRELLRSMVLIYHRHRRIRGHHTVLRGGRRQGRQEPMGGPHQVLQHTAAAIRIALGRWSLRAEGADRLGMTQEAVGRMARGRGAGLCHRHLPIGARLSDDYGHPSWPGWPPQWLNMAKYGCDW